LKAAGGALGAIVVVAVLGLALLSGQLSPGQVAEGLFGGAGGDEISPASGSAPSADAARRSRGMPGSTP
jgi:hypothetical protein